MLKMPIETIISKIKYFCVYNISAFCACGCCLFCCLKNNYLNGDLT